MSEKPDYKHVFRDGWQTNESLPFPIVLYPSLGPFIGFQETPGAPVMLCSCFRVALENYVMCRSLKRAKWPSAGNSDPTREYILDSIYFPRTLVESLITREIPNDDRVLAHLHFHHGLCHECNGVMPSPHPYSRPSSGFRASFEKYLRKRYWELGLEPTLWETGLGRQLCPDELLELIELDPVATSAKCQALRHSAQELGLHRHERFLSGVPLARLDEEARALWQQADALGKRLAKQGRRVMRLIEEEVRSSFGLPSRDDAWTSETILYHIISSLYPNLTIRRHYRPEYLGGLELDIYLVEPSLGIEYQGIQHFAPVRHWGGKEGLKKVRERDDRKARLCESEGVPIVYFTHEDRLSSDLVQERLSGLLINPDYT